MGLRIEPVRNAADLDQIRELFREYVGRLGIDLAFQGFDAELAQLPGKYAPPRGDLLLARGNSGEALGCVGLRPLEIAGSLRGQAALRAAGGARGGCRLGIDDFGRRTRNGTRLSPGDAGHLAVDESAIAIYRAQGFAPIPPYWDNAVPGIIYFGKRLQPD